MAVRAPDPGDKSRGDFDPRRVWPQRGSLAFADPLRSIDWRARRAKIAARATADEVIEVKVNARAMPQLD